MEWEKYIMHLRDFGIGIQLGKDMISWGGTRKNGNPEVKGIYRSLTFASEKYEQFNWF